MIPPKNNLEILINLFLRIYPKGGSRGRSFLLAHAYYTKIRGKSLVTHNRNSAVV
jgi:hypothetical protein